MLAVEIPIRSLARPRTARASPLHRGRGDVHMQSASTDRTATPVYIAHASTTGLAGDLAIPNRARGLVVFPHRSVMSRSAPVAQFLADVFYQRELATVLVDLLTEAEDAIDERTGKVRFDMTFLSTRILAICGWAQRDPRVIGLPAGLFVTNTTIGAALVAATQQPTGCGPWCRIPGARTSLARRSGA